MSHQSERSSDTTAHSSSSAGTHSSEGGSGTGLRSAIGSAQGYDAQVQRLVPAGKEPPKHSPVAPAPGAGGTEAVGAPAGGTRPGGGTGASARRRVTRAAPAADNANAQAGPERGAGAGPEEATAPATEAATTGGGAPRPPTPGASADIARRFPSGVAVAVHILPTEADRAEWLADVRANSTKTVSEYFGPTHVPAALRAHRESPVGPLADTIAAAKFNNDMTFSREATPHAAARQSVALDGGALEVGRSMAFTRQDGGPLPLIRGVSQAVGALPNAPQGNIKELAIFTHGQRTTLTGGSGRHRVTPGAMASEIGACLTPSVAIQLYACSAASEGGFADQLARALAEAGHTSRIFGHTSAAHATENAEGRTVVGQAGGGVEGATNVETCFPASFVAAQKTALIAELGLAEDPTKQAWLDQNLSQMMRTWAMPGRRGEDAIHKVMVANASAGGRATEVSVAQGLGTVPALAIAAMQAAWRTGAPGVTRGAEFRTLREGLEGRSSGARRRVTRP